MLLTLAAVALGPVGDGWLVPSRRLVTSLYVCNMPYAHRRHEPSVGYSPTEKWNERSAARTFDFIWRPKKAQVLLYKLSIDLKFGDSQTNLDADYVQRIRNLEAKGAFDVESTTKNFRVMTEEATETLPDEPPTLEHFDAKGRRQAAPSP